MNHRLQVLNFPELTTMEDNGINISSHNTLVEANFDKLFSVRSISISANNALTRVKMPSLNTVTDSASISNNPLLPQDCADMICTAPNIGSGCNSSNNNGSGPCN